MLNSFTLERLAEERVREAMRETEKARLIRAANGHRHSRGWPRSVMQVLKSPRARVPGAQS
jgi:hypothetical protein